MNRSLYPILLLVLATTMPAAVTNSEPHNAPVLLELFTSEGCSSCPPADRLLETFDRNQPVPGADLVVISEHVDYWNHLGWSDPYSSAFFSTRQRDYATHLESDEVYTPQLVVDGTTGFVGSDKRKALSVIEQAAHQPKLDIALTATRDRGSGNVRIEAPDAPQNAQLFLVLALDHARSSVSSGENGGRTLDHVAVAYAFSRVTPGQDLHVKLRPGTTRVIAFLQDPRTGKVLGIAHTQI